MTRGTPIAQEISFGIPKKKAKAKTKKAKGKGFLGALKEQAEKDSRKPDFNSAEFNHGALDHACARPLPARPRAPQACTRTHRDHARRNRNTAHGDEGTGSDSRQRPQASYGRWYESGAMLSPASKGTFQRGTGFQVRASRS